MKRILTYGTFDLFHTGHLNLLKRLRDLGDELYVGVSTDTFNATKNKRTFIPFESRAAIVRELRCVTEVFPEENWEQKKTDIVKYGISVFGMGSDWTGKFDHLNSLCDVVYLDRTEGISSTDLKNSISVFKEDRLKELLNLTEYLQQLIISIS